MEEEVVEGDQGVDMKEALSYGWTSIRAPRSGCRLFARRDRDTEEACTPVRLIGRETDHTSGAGTH